ncbi:hypothetical protein HK100_007374 [Physocladia obscura]|uniref:Uncharacterized protein n=1 Tax=Physocladia obscura TaxID=109957 RepID=A0AAD5SV22_9FUNG|nr:hypothetical protein HK100_007374 [Physocladia obscura]
MPEHKIKFFDFVFAFVLIQGPVVRADRDHVPGGGWSAARTRAVTALHAKHGLRQDVASGGAGRAACGAAPRDAADGLRQRGAPVAVKLPTTPCAKLAPRASSTSANGWAIPGSNPNLPDDLNSMFRKFSVFLCPAEPYVPITAKTVERRFDHHNLLKTVELNWNLGTLGSF